ncbi:MAG: hypothetical protein RSD47_00775 [Romboutsia sp.]
MENEQKIINMVLQRTAKNIKEQLKYNADMYGSEQVKNLFDKEFNKTLIKISEINLKQLSNEDIFFIRDCIMDYNRDNDYQEELNRTFKKYNKLMWCLIDKKVDCKRYCF